jgi:hypothetical protein
MPEPNGKNVLELDNPQLNDLTFVRLEVQRLNVSGRYKNSLKI